MTQLTSGKDEVSFDGDWSPDGSQIAFIHYQFGDDHLEVQVMDADGTKLGHGGRVRSRQVLPPAELGRLRRAAPGSDDGTSKLARHGIRGGGAPCSPAAEGDSARALRS